MSDEPDRLDKLLAKWKVSEPELLATLKSGRAEPPKQKKLYISGRHFKYGYFADAHIGHKKFHEELWDKMVRLFKREKVEFIVDCGDHLEGMSNRVGHVYELAQIGYDAQMNKAVELYSQLPADIYGIDGNHDEWYFKPQNMGVVIGSELERRVARYHNMGQGEGELEVSGVKIGLFHANDGTAYAVSYKLQKLVESFSGGEKPHILHSGHYHKALYMFIRNVHAFESATLCGQTDWMRRKKIQAHMGFGIVDVYYNRGGNVDRLEHKFVPHYE